MSDALLNPPREDHLARNLISLTQKSLRLVDERLLSQAMDRESYLQAIGARKQLADLLYEQERVYQRETTK